MFKDYNIPKFSSVDAFRSALEECAETSSLCCCPSTANCDGMDCDSCIFFSIDGCEKLLKAVGCYRDDKGNLIVPKTISLGRAMPAVYDCEACSSGACSIELPFGKKPAAVCIQGVSESPNWVSRRSYTAIQEDTHSASDSGDDEDADLEEYLEDRARIRELADKLDGMIFDAVGCTCTEQEIVRYLEDPENKEKITREMLCAWIAVRRAN